jgi:hypothetical protein
MRLEGALRASCPAKCFNIAVPDAGDRAAALGIERRHYISALFAAFLARHTNTADFHIGYKPCSLPAQLKGFESLCATMLPLHLHLDINKTASSQIALLASQMQTAEKHATYRVILPCAALTCAQQPFLVFPL